MEASIQGVSSSFMMPTAPATEPTLRSTGGSTNRADPSLSTERSLGPALPRAGQETPGRLVQEIAFANATAEFFDKKVSFSYDERIDRVVVTIIDDSTEKVIRQVPPEEMVELIARFKEDFRGLIFNRQG